MAVQVDGAPPQRRRYVSLGRCYLCDMNKVRVLEKRSRQSWVLLHLETLPSYYRWLLPACRAVRRQYSAAASNGFLVLLCLTAGMFVSSTGFLPSSFTMYALTAAAAGVLEGKPYRVIIAAVIGAWALGASPTEVPSLGVLLASHARLLVIILACCLA